MLLSAVQTLHCLHACLSYAHLPLCACQADMLGALKEQSNLGRVGLTTARPSCTVSPSHCSPCLTLSVVQQFSGLRVAHVKFLKNMSLSAAYASTQGRVSGLLPSARSDWNNALPSRMFW